MYDPDKYKAARFKPLQARGKERVRLVLSTALTLFKENGIEDVTTNDIAKVAHIPIGSLYRYFPNKDAIVSALIELYVEDITQIFKDIGKHPVLQYLAWDEVLLLTADAWVNYGRLNRSFAFLYLVRANPRLRAKNHQLLDRFAAEFKAVLRTRCPEITNRQAAICFQLTNAAVEMGINDDEYDVQPVDSLPLYYDAVSIIAAHMFKVCLPHKHNAHN